MTRRSSSSWRRSSLPQLFRRRRPEDPIRIWVGRLLHGRGGLLARHAHAGAEPRARGRRARSRSSAPTSTSRRCDGPATGSIPTRSQRTYRSNGCSGSSAPRVAPIGCARRCAISSFLPPHDLLRDPPFSHARPGGLPQPAHLPAARRATGCHLAVPLRAAIRMASCSWGPRRRSTGLSSSSLRTSQLRSTSGGMRPCGSPACRSFRTRRAAGQTSRRCPWRERPVTARCTPGWPSNTPRRACSWMPTTTSCTTRTMRDATCCWPAACRRRTSSSS